MPLIAAIQINSKNCLVTNLSVIEKYLDIAKQRGVKMVLLPENCAYMDTNHSRYAKIAESLLPGGRVMTAFSGLAKKYGVWLLIGSFPTINKGRVYQTLLAYNDSGSLVDFYHKRHLFDVDLPNTKESYRESDSFVRGDDIKVLKTPWGKVGLAICYDLRFPEHFRALLDLGANLLVLPAAFTYDTGKSHWEILLRARAIENQCYLLAAGQSGYHPGGRRTWGHSMIVDPWGVVLDSITVGEGIIIAKWDKEKQDYQRAIFPVLKHRFNKK